MADGDNITINNVDLPQDVMWATQKVQLDLLKTLEKIYDLSEKQKDTIDKTFKEMQKTGKVDAAQVKNMGGDSKKGGSGAIKTAVGDMSTGLKTFTTNISGTSEGLDHLDDKIGGFGKGLSNVTKKMGVMGGVVAAIFGQAGAALKTFTETVSVFRQFNEVGITVKGGVIGFHEAISKVGISMEHMAELTSKYSRTVGNVGIRAIVDMTQAAEQSGFAFSKYGVTLDEAVGFQTKLMESQRLGGLFHAQDAAKEAIASQENLKRLTAYSKILNVSRDEMIEARMANKGRADIQRMFNAMPEELRIASNKSFDQFSDLITALGPETAKGMQIFTDIIADEAGMASQSFTELAQVSPELAESISEIRRKIRAGEDVGLEEIENFRGVLEAATKSGQLNSLSMGENTKDMADYLGGTFLNSLRNAGEKIEDYKKQTAAGKTVLETMEGAQNKSVIAMTQFQSELDMLAGKTETARLKVFSRAIGKTGEDMLEGATKFVHKMGVAVEDFGEDPVKFIKDLFAKIVDSFSLYVIEPLMGYLTIFGDWLKGLGPRLINFIKESLGFDVKTEVERQEAERIETIANTYSNIESKTGITRTDIDLQNARYARDAAGTTSESTKTAMSEFEARLLTINADQLIAIQALLTNRAFATDSS